MAKIAVMGYGNIGNGVVTAISMNQEILKKSTGQNVEVKYVLDLREFPGDPMENKVVHDYKVIAEDPEISLVVETMGGVEPAFTFVKAMLLAGKSVVTSNKALVADKGAILLEIAKENKVNFFFEASVGGGIPIIRPLRSILNTNQVNEICGILNGTTNYILTEMDFKDAEFDATLKKAQDLGYAERDPSADIEGFDTCRKIAILSSIACGKTVKFTDIHTEGITRVSGADFKYAKAMDGSIKLLARSILKNGKIRTIVAPYLVFKGHPLYGVYDVFNGVMVAGNVVDELMFYGRGAGKLPTADAVISDVVEALNNPGTTLQNAWTEEVAKPDDYMDYNNSFLVRLPEDADPALYEKVFPVEKVFTGLVPGEIAVQTGYIKEKEYLAAAKELGCVLGFLRLYR